MMQIMEALEQLARGKGYSYFILESGEPLVAAMRLYRSLGYMVMPNYGQYINMAGSVCMKKKLLRLGCHTGVTSDQMAKENCVP